MRPQISFLEAVLVVAVSFALGVILLVAMVDLDFQGW